MAINPLDFLKNLTPENTTLFGSSPNPNLKRMAELGLLNGNYEDIVADATKRANFSGLLNTTLSYLMQPKNQNVGSVIPYLATAAKTGVNASQKEFDKLDENAITNANLEFMKNRIANNKKNTESFDILTREEVSSGAYGDLDPTKTYQINRPKNKISILDQNVEDNNVFSKLNPLTATDKSKKDYKNSITLENPTGDITLLKPRPSEDTDSRTNFTKLINARDNLDPNNSNYEANYKFYTDKIEKETSFAPPLVDMSSTQETGYSKKYGENQGKTFFEKDQAFVESGPNALKQFNKTNRALILANKPDTKSGSLAKLRLLGEKAKRYFGGTPTQAALDSIDDTELLSSTLASDVFPLIGELNIGARGIDTPAERDFLQMAFTGDIEQSQESLMKLTAIRNKYQLSKLQDFNEGIKDKRFSKEGEYRRDVKSMSYKFQPVAIINPNTIDLMYKNENQIKLNDDGATVTVNTYGEEGNEVYIDTQGYVWGKGKNNTMNKLGPLNKLGVEF